MISNSMLEILKYLWSKNTEIVALFTVAMEIVKELNKLYKDSLCKKNAFNKKFDDYLFDSKKELGSLDKNLIRELATKEVKNHSPQKEE